MQSEHRNIVYSRTQRGKKGQRIALKGSNMNGYRVHKIYFEGQKHMIRAHQIIWFLCNGSIPKGMMIDHINRNKTDNRIKNLRLVTPKGNAENKEQLIGINNPMCKLDPKHHVEMRELYRDGMGCREIAKLFGISKSRTHQIVSTIHTENRVNRLRALGNAIVPQVAMAIMKAIKYAEERMKGGQNDSI